MSQEFRLKDINETRNYFLEEIEQNESTVESRKHKKVCKTLNLIEHFLILAFAITRCICFFTWYSSWYSQISKKHNKVNLFMIAEEQHLMEKVHRVLIMTIL